MGLPFVSTLTLIHVKSCTSIYDLHIGQLK